MSIVHIIGWFAVFSWWLSGYMANRAARIHDRDNRARLMICGAICLVAAAVAFSS